MDYSQLAAPNAGLFPQDANGAYPFRALPAGYLSPDQGMQGWYIDMLNAAQKINPGATISNSSGLATLSTPDGRTLGLTNIMQQDVARGALTPEQLVMQGFGAAPAASAPSTSLFRGTGSGATNLDGVSGTRGPNVQPPVVTQPAVTTTGVQAPATSAPASDNSSYLDLLNYLQQHFGAGGGGGAPSAPAAGATSTTPSSPMDTDYLRFITQMGGLPTDVGPAWDAMVAAQKQNQDRQFADLTEAFNVSGNRFSTAFGDAAQQFQNQATLDQNSLLGQLSLQSQEAARARMLAGAGQLSAQELQALMQQSSQAFGAAQGLYGNENNAAYAQALQQQQLLALLQGMAGQYSGLNNQNLFTGMQLGQQQQALQQQQLTALYNEWMRTQPEYSSLLPYLQAAAGGYPMLQYPAFQPSTLGQTLGGVGSLLGNSAAILKLFGIG